MNETSGVSENLDDLGAAEDEGQQKQHARDFKKTNQRNGLFYFSPSRIVGTFRDSSFYNVVDDPNQSLSSIKPKVLMFSEVSSIRQRSDETSPPEQFSNSLEFSFRGNGKSQEKEQRRNE